MPTSRALWAAVYLLLTGGCDVLWGRFYIPNLTDCELGAGACTVPADDGGGSSSDGGSGSGSDGGAPADMSCIPLSTPTWQMVTTLPPPAANLRGISGAIAGNGTEIWVVGDSYAAHKDTLDMWNQIVLVPPTLSLGRAVLDRGGGLFAIAGQSVVQLDRTSQVKLQAVATGAATVTAFYDPNFGIYPTASTSDGHLFQWNNTTWVDIANNAPFGLQSLSGATVTGETLWGASTSVVASWSAVAQKWSGTGAAAPITIHAMWSDAGKVWLVGPNGAIATASQPMPGFYNFTQEQSITGKPLRDVVSDGTHVWVVGDGGTVLHWDTGCKMWRTEMTATTQNLYAVWVGETFGPPARKMVWAAGDNGTVIYRDF